MLKDIFDPCLGLHWQLRIDPKHPDGPRRMALIAAPSPDAAAAPTPEAAPGGDFAAPRFAVRAGDRVTVEQNLPVLHARLQAIALQSAAPGQIIRVRLGIGPNQDFAAPVIAVRVLAPGTALWLTPERVLR